MNDLSGHYTLYHHSLNPTNGCVESCREERKRKREGGGSKGQREGENTWQRHHNLPLRETSTTHLASEKQITQCVRYHSFQGCSLIPELGLLKGSHWPRTYLRS